MRIALIYWYKLFFLRRQFENISIEQNNNSRFPNEICELPQQQVLGQIYSVKNEFCPIELTIRSIRQLLVSPMIKAPLGGKPRAMAYTVWKIFWVPLTDNLTELVAGFSLVGFV